MHNPARPGPGIRLCGLAELADPGAQGFIFRRDAAMFLGFVVRTGGDVRGYVDHCPHAGMPLALLPGRYLTREGDLILCSSHGALFRPRDGYCVAGPCAGKVLEPWAVVAENGDLLTA
jgi:nitrite reductase/ring-hydroxylating ferredoxin subunit